MAMSKEVILDEAILLLNEKGIHSLTMRELASRLNIKASSLYWHIKNKDELLQLVSDSICQKIYHGDDTRSPREQIIQICNSYRRNLLDVRDSVEIFNSTVPMTPVRVGLIASILNKLEYIGIERDFLIQTGNLINNFVLAFVADEIRMMPVANFGIKDFLGYPVNFDFDKQFNDGLDIILNGVINTIIYLDKSL